jgi:alpha-ribazole phosphatase
MLELYLVRHTSVAAPAGTCYGQTDVALAPTFRHEAEAVKGVLTDISFDEVYSSPLSRCTMLADYCGYPAYRPDARLMEMNFGDWEDRLWDGIQDPHLPQWFAAWATERTTNGESFADVCNRASSFMDSLRCDGDLKRVVIFSHAGFIRALWVVLGRYTPEEAFAKAVSYGEVVQFTIANGMMPKWRVK